MPHPARERANAGQQLTKVEGLGQIPVRPGVKPLDARFHRIAGGQHQNRDIGAVGPQLAAERDAVFLRQHHVEHDGVVVVLDAQFGRRAAIARHVNRVRRLPQPLRDEPRRARLVLYQQNAHSGSLLQELHSRDPRMNWSLIDYRPPIIAPRPSTPDYSIPLVILGSCAAEHHPLLPG